jgi:hypothetical protein
MSKSICIKCGGWKNHPLSACKSCKYSPKSNLVDSAKSVRLSTLFGRGTSEHKVSNAELSEARNKIMSGIEYPFNPIEISELLREKELLEIKISFTDKLKLAGFVLLFFVPGVAALYIIITK